jgi:hypothetical protein
MKIILKKNLLNNLVVSNILLTFTISNKGAEPKGIEE